MARGLTGVQHIVAVASGKGGVGKTTVTVHLALALAAIGQRVAIFDADIYGPNVPLMLGVRRSGSAPGLLPIMRVQREPYIPALERFGVKMMSLGLLVGERDAVMPDPHDAGRIVTQTLGDVRWGELDILLVDLPPGTGEPQHSLMRTYTVDGVVLVTTPQDMSLLDVGRSLSMFQQAGIPILGLVENMSYALCPRCGEQIELFARSARQWPVQEQAPELLGRLPITPDMGRPIDAEHPLVQATAETPEATSFKAIAARIVERLAAPGA
ncbi:MAG TPA: P-loop NTPase [Roseiflexaceae bacterium]|nr:P-loop NTPase [Roseiflexaceae bacterium]